MAYVKQTWNSGETLSAEKFNHIEAGVNSNYILVTIDYDEGNGIASSNVSFAEAKAAFLSGISLLFNIHITNSVRYLREVIIGTFTSQYISYTQDFKIHSDYFTKSWSAEGFFEAIN